ncbi:MAG: YggS family pyridoxal phosphate-dependent enzyme [Treponema sp.]
MSESIKENIVRINERIQAACKKAGRRSEEVSLLLATKTVEPARIIEAFACGCTLIGENKVQELKEKYSALAAVPHTTHFIGHLQSNKVKEVIKYVQCVQSVDRLDVAQKLEQHAAQSGRLLEVLIEVNTSGEPSKYGCTPQEALPLAKAVAALTHLRVQGLMTIGALSEDAEKVRACFRCLKQLQLEIQNEALLSVPVLSMGMSDDMEIAIEEGSTLVRVGTAAFGSRTYPIQQTAGAETL